MIDARVTPLAFDEDGDGRVTVTVDQLVRDRDGDEVARRVVLRRYELHGGLIARMDVVDPTAG
jgi:hypothetical protein